jgi:hypothetical protein
MASRDEDELKARKEADELRAKKESDELKAKIDAFKNPSSTGRTRRAAAPGHSPDPLEKIEEQINDLFEARAKANAATVARIEEALTNAIKLRDELLKQRSTRSNAQE